MEKVMGIGGLFFRANNPKELGKWYEKNLGINLVPQGLDDTPWAQEAGPTHFVPFSSNTDYFGKNSQMWMVNFRVSNLDAMVSQLRDTNITVEINSEHYPNGRFARLYDPEGNPIELWEPKA